MEEELLKTEQLCRQYQCGKETVNAVKNVDLQIRKGSLTILRGASGSGKTTLINLLGALDSPSSGSIWFKNKEISRLTEHKRDDLRKKHMGFVFQTIGLISMMSAYENVDFGLRISGFPDKERKEWAESCLHQVGMYKRRDHRPFELSGGEQQRVAIARAIAHSPEIIFADEPTSALDTMLGLQVVKLFRDLVEKQNMTIVMTTHDPDLMDIADKVYSLQDGEVVHE